MTLFDKEFARLGKGIDALASQRDACLRELDLAADTIERQKNDIKLLVRENVRLSNALEERGRRRMEAA